MAEKKGIDTYQSTRIKTLEKMKTQHKRRYATVLVTALIRRASCDIKTKMNATIKQWTTSKCEL